MPQKIHLGNKNNRPAVGRFSSLAELGLRPIQAEPVQNNPRGNWPNAPWYALALAGQGGKDCGLGVVSPGDNGPTTWTMNPGLRFRAARVTPDKARVVRKAAPLSLRYCLVAFDGKPPTELLNSLAKEFDKAGKAGK